MYLLDSGSNYLEGNNVSNNYGNGISLLYCKNNTLYRNNASLNLGMGIYLTGSVGNRIYGNDLVGNGDYNAYDDGNNSWDDGFLWGNHYGDFSCEDLEADNVCDSPYYIPGGSSIDRFPLAAYLMEVSFCEVADEIFTEWSEYINESDSIEDEDTKEPGVLNRVGL
jgi:parallel beta-helix repeat protein